MSKVLLIGSPNSGKSLLFNRLTGLHHKVANFPGITVDVSTGRLPDLPGFELIDFPGTYSLQAISEDERVAVDYFERSLDDADVSHVLCVVDATRLEKSLYFTLQVIRESARHGKPVTVLANMMDVLESHKLSLDIEQLAQALQAPVLPVSGRSGKGIKAVVAALKDEVPLPRTWATEQSVDVPDEQLRIVAHKLAQRFGTSGDVLIRVFLHYVPVVPEHIHLGRAADGCGGVHAGCGR